MAKATPHNTDCDTDPNSPCNRTVATPPFFCPSGQQPDPVCLSLCQQAFQAAVDAAQFQACAATAAACLAKDQAEARCQSWADECIAQGNDPEVCAASVTACVGQAAQDYADAIGAAETAFDFAVAQAKVAFYSCAAQCCYEH